MLENNSGQLWQPSSEGLAPVAEAHQEEIQEGTQEEEADHQDHPEQDR